MYLEKRTLAAGRRMVWRMADKGREEDVAVVAAEMERSGQISETFRRDYRQQKDRNTCLYRAVLTRSLSHRPVGSIWMQVSSPGGLSG